MPDLFLPLLALGVSMSFTPGPNNFMVAASGANFGWRRTLPLYFGIIAGFVSLLLAVGFGLGAVFDRYPILHEILRYAGAAYLIWLGVKIATGWGGKSAPSDGGEKAPANDTGRGKPIGFFQGAAFQWVNPKAWVLAVGAMAAFTLVDRPMAPQVLMIVAVLGALAVPSLGLWLGSGVLLARYLKTERAMRIFNIALGCLCIASVIFIFV
jgi:threonine/homoserine/homoserine lactone efflux protein